MVTSAAVRSQPLWWIVVGGAALLVSMTVAIEISRKLARSTAELERAIDALTAGAETVEHDFQLSAGLQPLRDALGRLAVDLDADRREIEQREAALAATLNAMVSGVIALDGEDRILMMSRQAAMMLNVDDAERVRERLLQEVTRQPDLLALVQDRTAIARNEMTQIDHDPARGDAVEFTLGSRRIRAVLATFGRSEGGDAVEPADQRLIVLNDMTDIRRLEQLRSDFAANVSHELRTPITSIKGYVEALVEAGTDDREQTQRFIEVIRKNTERLIAIVEDVLTLTYLERPRGQGALETEAVSITQVFERVVEFSRDAAAAREMTIVFHVTNPDDTELLVQGHQHLLEQAIGNLVANAIRYSPPGKRIEMTASIAQSRAGMIAIEVRDEGIGIEAKHLPRIFERFYRVDRARSRDVGGTGLGLAIVKHIVSEHGGEVSVKSEVGKGSCFTLLMKRAG
ncbi:MAG: sensor histidine kinase [Phycisphaerales bacterium]